ncbi:MAG: DUF86 domain-containing protein [Clostridiales bacterium]|nr:DUF86 domain-containing protein [Clostridiales bacterium]
MRRDDTQIERITSELDFIKNSTRNVAKGDFLSNDLLQHAIMMSLISIGECANRLSDAFKEKHSQVEWAQIVAVRNIAAHGYWQLNMEQVWQALAEDIPALKSFVDSL